ncbi:hypothetical protein IV203_018147 [Nitzschia inconspicua]|uniref:Uncharacterized protein n=1 Tax=Nitzschia inconspicua TaxID=303405 RepID=A0A9K3M0Z4_9STRA|nr:hypothetical protein IV203_018147 [Nitzschia inconspicua]
MGLSSSFLHLSLALLVGLYAGINISSFHRLPIVVNPSSTTPSSLRKNPEVENDTQFADIQKLKSENEQWKAKVNQLEKDYASSLNKMHDMEESCSKFPADTADQHQDLQREVSLSTKYSNAHPVCQSSLSNPTPSAMALWNQHLLKIFEATRVPTDRKWQFHDFTAQLLQIITPRLPRSVKTTPHDWRPVEQALTVVWERYQYLQLSAAERRKVSNPPRPLKILIMGGSLLVGTNCRMLMKELNFQFRLPKRECTWSNRLGEFLNALVDQSNEAEPLVQVTKVAMGGTNTATGSIIWQYDLIPPESRNPDIVLNAYSTNDMHILTILEAQSSNTTLRERTFDMMQAFVRQILQTRHCPDHSQYGGTDDVEPIPPLLLHMDDYLGNEQRKIWETTELSQGVQVLANYYGFVSMSYADVVRDLVYGDTYETWFSSEWWKKTKNVETFEREIHPGMGMHIASTWVTAYNLLELVSSFCSLPNPYHPKNIGEYEAGLWGLPELRRTEKEPKGKPQPQPKCLQPVLTKDLLLEDVTALWKKDAEKVGPPISCSSMGTLSDDASSKTLRIKCPFSWVSGLSLQQNNVTFVQEYFQQQSSVWKGWQLSDDKDKIGFVPIPDMSHAGNVTTLVLDFVYPQPIRSITFFFMKSYGPKWKDSQLQVNVWHSGAAGRTLLQGRQLIGVHNKTTSEMYTEEIRLKEPQHVAAGEKLQLEATLVGGSTFKIMGLAVCS